MNSGPLSLVTDYGENSSSCGYCGGKRHSSWSHGMNADSLTVEAYQELLDRGWRRSGRWVYYPLQDRSCCQLLTIRLDVTRFKPNKEQRRVQRRWQAFLEGGPLQIGPADQQQKQQAPPPASDPGSPGLVAGGSPKRPHEDISRSPSGKAHGHRSPQQHQQLQVEEEGAGNKRSRRAVAAAEEAMEADREVVRPPRGSSPASRLSQQLQQALWSPFMQPEVEQEHGRMHEQHIAVAPPPPQQQQQAAAPNGETQLATALAAALQQAVEAGLLPSAAYPAPKVHQPSAKQRKQLPAGVTHTTAFALAAAAAASKARSSGTGDAAAASGEAVAALLLERLPAELSAGAQAVRGHLNFCLPQLLPQQQQASAAAAPAARASSSHEQVEQAATEHQRQQPGTAGCKGDGSSSAASSAAAAVPRGVPHHFELHTLPSNDPSITQVEFQLFKKYQVVHHGDKPSDVSHHSFKRFLVDTPLPHVGPEAYPPGGCPPMGFGSFHQQYWLDGRLVAVGVVDVLPRCLSSKYLFWDPDMSALSLGKLTSLREIEWVQEVQKSCPALRYYYLGFYIHNCHRMRYKGGFSPSDLLCPKNKCWVPLERIQDKLDQPGMIPISELPGALEGLGPGHLVDAVTGQPTCPPREPSTQDLAACKLLLRMPGGRGGQPQARVVTLGHLQQLGMLQPGSEDSLVDPISKWWSRVGASAAAMTVLSI